MSTQQGFTLIEVILVITLLAIISVPLFGLFSQAGIAVLNNENIQTAIQLAQARAEHLVAVRRNQGYSAEDISADRVENLNGSYAGFTRATSINNAYGSNDCPVTTTCKQVTVSVSRSGQTHAEISFVLINY